LKKAIEAGEAGFGVRQVGGGYWIALQSLCGAVRAGIALRDIADTTALEPWVIKTAVPASLR